MAAPTQAEQIAAHTAQYASSKTPIKDDVVQLAACWKTGSGPLTKQEAGLLLWYHSQRGEDGAAEVLAAGVVTICLDVLGNSAALPADKSTAAGLLLSLCADDAGREQVVKAKASGATGAPCCLVLHRCLANPAAAPRHAAALLSCLASSPVGLSVLLKSLAGPIPWGIYGNLLCYSHEVSKDHATSIHTANCIQQLVTGREVLAADAAEAGVLEALLAATAAHKSAAAVGAGASCLTALCLAAPTLCSKLGQLQGAVQKVVDLLGPPPATVMAWEQQQLQQAQPQSPHGQHTTAPAGPDEPAARSPHYRTSSIRVGSGNAAVGGVSSNSSNSSQHVRVSEQRSRSGAVDGLEGDGASVKDPTEEQQQGMQRNRRKSLRILSVAEGEAIAHSNNPSSTGADASSPNMRSKSQLGCIKQSSMTGFAPCTGNKATSLLQPRSCGPALRAQPLSINSTLMKWEAPVPLETRAAAAGLLAQLVQLPHLREAASDRLAASRLAALINSTMQQLAAAPGKKGKSGGKKGSSKLVLTPETERLLAHICVCLEFLVAGDNADCYTVAAYGCLPALVQLASDSKNTQLRRAAKAVVAQVMLVGEAQQYVQQAEVPEDLTALEEGSQVLLRLRDDQIKQLLVEFPKGCTLWLHALDDVTARARV